MAARCQATDPARGLSVPLGAGPVPVLDGECRRVLACVLAPVKLRSMTRIGIDFGGVVVTAGGAGTRGDTSLAGAELEEVAQPGVFDAVRALVQRCAGRVWIVSKARPHMQARSRGWLEAVDFHGRTGLPREHVRFCLEREDKAAICRELGVTHFVDDRVHLMQILRGVVPRLYLFGDPRDVGHCPPWATWVTTWAELMRALEPDLPPAGGAGG